MTISIRLFVFCTVFSGLTSAQSFSVSGHRPMAEILDLIEVAIGVPIHYEDPPYQFAGGLEDAATQEMRMRVGNPKFQIFVPKRAALSVARQSSAFPSDFEKTSQIQAAVGAFLSTGLKHEFELQKDGKSFFVLPQKTANQEGTMTLITSVMSQMVTIPMQRRPVHEAIALLLEVAAKSAGAKAVLGNAPFFPQQMVSLGANQEPARAVLVKLLEQVGPAASFSYRLLFDPTLRYYMMNLQPVAGVNQRSVPSVPSFSPPQSDSKSSRWFQKNPAQ